MKQILYRIKSLFLLVAIAGGISACADDKGNYNYHDIPEVKIEGIGNSITALAYQNLSIPVQLDGLQADENRYEYEWLAIRQFEAEDANDTASNWMYFTNNKRIFPLSRQLPRDGFFFVPKMVMSVWI